MINLENIEEIAGLTTQLEVLINKLEESYNKRKKEIFDKTKKEILEICNNIDRMLR